jgi:hypothetical protein
MKNNTIQSILAGIAEEAAPSAEIDLWKGIQRQLESSESISSKGESLMKPYFVQRPLVRRLALAALALVLALAVLFATPQGRAWAQEIIRFFTRSGSDTLPYTPQPLVWMDVTPGALPPTSTPLAAFALDCGDYDKPGCSAEQIRSKVDFPVVELGSIPEGMHFVGATGGPDRVWLLYDNGQYGWGLSISEERWTGTSEVMQWQIGASAVVETVQIDAASGEYVKGAFVVPLGNQLVTPAPGTNNQVWDGDAGVQTLHWVDHGIFFSMEQWGPAAILDKAGIIALAESLTTGPVAASSSPIPAAETPVPAAIKFKGNLYDLSVSQANQQAGFEVLQPGRLPDILSFAGAAYQPENRVVRIFFIQQNPGMPDNFGLTVAEQQAPNGAGCSLCGIVVGDYIDPNTSTSGMTVGAAAVIETVKVGETTGQYVEGYWMPTGGFFTWVSAPFVKTLRWQADGIAYELQYSGYSINNVVPVGKADLIAIAESMLK